MKIKHPNFNHIDSDSLEFTHVPDHLIRKHWSLQVIEMYHLVVCFFIGIFAYKILVHYGIFQAIVPCFLTLSFVVAALLSITDNYRFRVAVLSSQLTLSAITLCAFILSPISKASFAFLSIIFAQSLLVIAVVILQKRNRSYYIWCKSIAGKI